MEEAIKLFREGHSLREIERMTGINRKKISRELKEQGYVIEAMNGNSNYDKRAKYELGEQLYLAGRSIKSICKQLHTTPITFSNWLKAKGYEIRSNKSLTIKEYEQKQIKLRRAEELFYQGMSRTQIAREVRINDNVLAQHFQNIGFDCNAQARKYFYNEQAFEDITTEEQAYWLGFLYADGAISKERNTIELCLKDSDEEHLEKFQAFMCTSSPIKEKNIKLHSNIYKAKRITIYSRKIANDLIKLKCTPRKSLNLKFPETNIVPDSLINHFMRGYVDGDGSLSLSNNNKSCLVEIIGTKQFLEGIVDRYSLPLSKEDFRNHGKAFGLYFSRKELVYPFLKAIYGNASISLARKYNRAINYLQTNETFYKNLKITMECRMKGNFHVRYEVGEKDSKRKDVDDLYLSL